MKTYDFEFTTKINFDLPIINHSFILKCFPQNCLCQRICNEKLTVEPYCSYTTGKDSFGNKTIGGTINTEHSEFLFSVKGSAVLSRYRIPDNLDRLYLYPGQKTKASNEMNEFLDSLDIPRDTFKAAEAISDGVHRHMTYLKGATDSNTAAAEAFALGKGVCQDYAHIAIALMRKAKIPARYVAGFIEGDGETHAWVEYYANGAWYGIDPTNNNKIEYGYIRLSQGRDSYDCSVERGCFASKKGIVSQTSEILVRVGEQL